MPSGSAGEATQQRVEPRAPGAVGHHTDPPAAGRVETHDIPESNAGTEVLDVVLPVAMNGFAKPAHGVMERSTPGDRPAHPARCLRREDAAPVDLAVGQVHPQ